MWNLVTFGCYDIHQQSFLGWQHCDNSYITGNSNILILFGFSIMNNQLLLSFMMNQLSIMINIHYTRVPLIATLFIIAFFKSISSF